MSMLKNAYRNLELAGLFSPESNYGGMIGHAVMKLMETHCAERHSGNSSSMTVQIFSLVVQDKPLTGKYWDEKFNEMVELSKSHDGDWTLEMHTSAFGQRP
jgi:hypothetical protein